MNKTLTVNIGGMVFHIEEHAYEKMRKYLEAIKGYFTTSDGRDEIIQDVESRIAEMFAERIKDSKQVIVEDDVEHVISVMGRPEQFAGDEAGSEKGETTYAANISEKRSYRKIYRDPDEKVIAGVCAGLAHRLGIDPIWLRIAALATFTFGSFFVYIILALILPYAITTAQKLEMRGEDVTVSNIRKAVEEPSQRRESFVSRFFDTLGDLLKGIFKIFMYIVGAFFALIGLVVLFALFVALFAVLGVGGISIPVYISDLFLTSSQQFWSMLAIFLIVGIPVIMLIYAGIRILFHIKHTNRIFRMTAISLMILGWIIGFWMLADIGREFAVEGKQRTSLPLLKPDADTLYVDVMKDGRYEDDEDTHSRHHIGFMFGHRMSVITGDEMRMIPENVTLNVQKADGDKFELVELKSSKGTNEKEAYNNASKINYNLEQKDSLILFSRYFPLPPNIKYRDQKVKLILKVPVGKSVHFNKDVSWIIYDIDNVTDTYDGDMVNKTWTMTQRGLECKSCNFSDWDNDNSKNTDINVDDANIHIDNKGVHIKAKGKKDSGTKDEKDVNINIDENGVVIDSKKK
jgi:phage shock protein PspC (stress-responsive transcriptional regulator)